MTFKLTSAGDAKAVSEFYLNNSEHLRLWEPLRDDGYHLPEAWEKRLDEREIEQSEGRAAYFVSYNPVVSEVVAMCSLTNIVRGPFQACYMGYSISAKHQGKGLMKDLCRQVIGYAFNELGLNRIMANYMLNNHRSAALLDRLGFVKEGVAKDYLFINGNWEDHILTSLLNPQAR